jgi:putative ABC transport system substrate-binding protein
VKCILVYCLFALIGWLWTTSEAFADEERLIAVIISTSQPRYQDIHSIFVELSKDFCSEHCQIYVQNPNADVMSLRNSVRKAVALSADLIVTYGPAASLAAKAESPKSPVLFVDVYDPVGLGLVSGKSLTGHNMTGIRGDAPVQALFKYFTETIPVDKLVVLYDEDCPESLLQRAVLEESAKKKGVEIVSLSGTGIRGQVFPFQSIPGDADGIFLATSEFTWLHLNDILSFAEERSLPVVSEFAGGAEEGIFMVLETSVEEQGEKLAEMAGQVLSGTKINEITMYKPHRVSFIVNLKVAKKLDISVPFQTLSVASRVVR